MKIANLSRYGMKTGWSGVLHWLEEQCPDIVTLQKTGAERNFPTKKLRDLKYNNICLDWKCASDPGVAILSHFKLRPPKDCVRQLRGASREESRFLSVQVGRLKVCSVYAPYLGYLEPEVAIKERIAWMTRLRKHIYGEGYHRCDTILCGDFNVKVKADGPLKELDKYYNSEELQDTLENLGFIDLYRRAHSNFKTDAGFTIGFSEKTPDGTSRLHLALASHCLAQRLRINAFVDDKSVHRGKSAPLVLNLHGLDA